MLPRNTSTPARNNRSIISGDDEAGPSVAISLTRRLRRIVFICPLVWICQAYCPFLGFACIDLEKSCSLITAIAAILNTSNGKRLVVGAHKVLTYPFTASIIVDGVHIDKAAWDVTLEQSFARLRRNIPPTFRGPAVFVLIADCDTNTAVGGIT